MNELRLYLGGSFDPIHHGHLQSASELAKRLSAQHTWLLPAKLSPLKQRTHVSDQHRLKMLQLATCEYPDLKIDEREMHREGASYSHKTLKELRAEVGPNISVVFAMGMDSFNHLDRWNQWQNLTDHAHLAVFSRPGYSGQFSPALNDWLAPRRIERPEQLLTRPHGLIWLTELTPFAISSTQLREQLSQQPNLNALSSWTPTSVASYILENHLYGVSFR
jgi:nicotinate-nucleotide adenylyltransferase